MEICNYYCYTLILSYFVPLGFEEFYALLNRKNLNYHLTVYILLVLTKGGFL